MFSIRMRRIFQILGIVICVIALSGIIRTISSDHGLSQFELGYLAGKLILFILGAVILVVARGKRPLKK